MNHSPQRGTFISFEGIDGAGKSTHIRALADRFQAAGREVVLTREPGGTPLAEKIRNLVLNDAMDPLTESLLVFAARRDHVQTVIRPALLADKVVLCDRFTDATFAYQGGGRGFDWSVLQSLEQWVQADPLGQITQPDLTVWFHLDPALAAKRLQTARVADRFEAESLAFFERVSAAYQRRADQQSERFVVLNADQSIEQVGQDLVRQLQLRRVLP